ncbi:ribosome silencing factor [Aliifodinibius sp. S!AR15-10]|uniref:ribosome silencing factor n=1 Tax=Aliifodinibius sp. S!AR15-10 TaxID=2950437 RepID=UPI00285C8810|nr:ribosome silencing factor [Aliifodinibius sp. S!AR15-10]MDR8394105.1 ribosome silencing factor [Aliifodinibius sp. S!AR15-10]
MTQNAQTKKNEQQFTSISPSKTADADKLVEVITNALLEKKGEEITILDVHELTTLTDKFVVCHATSEVQIKALANSVIQATKEELGESVWKEEGRESRRWVILDYVNVVVHIFKKELRDYYALERMWNDAEVTRVEDN